jgi:hypothetical protein
MGGPILAALAAVVCLQISTRCPAAEQPSDAPGQHPAAATAAPDRASGNKEPEAPTSESSAPKKTLRQRLRSLAKKILPARERLDLEFKEASAQFPDFCRHWKDNLRERERNNLSKMALTLKDGVHSGTYTGYGEIEVCEAHQSKEGFSIGKITYEEFVYSLAGKTPEEAAHAEKKTISDIRTTEIFRWENDKWFQ